MIVASGPMYRKPFVVISLCHKPRIGLEGLALMFIIEESYTYVNKGLYSCGYSVVSQRTGIRGGNFGLLLPSRAAS